MNSFSRVTVLSDEPGPGDEGTRPQTARPTDAQNFCPNCSSRLVDHRCKLKCPQCEYYLSCSDFY